MRKFASDHIDLSDANIPGLVEKHRIRIDNPLLITVVQDGMPEIAEFKPLSISYFKDLHYIARIFEGDDAILGFDSMEALDGKAAVTKVSGRPAKWWAGKPLEQEEKTASVVIYRRV